MKKISINRVRAKVRHYKMQKSKAQSKMEEGNLNDYIKDLISLYQAKTQLDKSLILVETRK
jgi:hypothetical protein